MATALERYYKLRASGHDKPGALREVVRCAMQDTWIDGQPYNFDHEFKTRDNLIRTIVWYFAEYENEAIEIVLKNGKPAVELSFALPVDDGIVFCGHIDRLVNYADSLYVMDQKTTGSVIGPWWFNQFTPDTQMSMYTYAGKVIYSLPVQGVLIDGMQIAVGFTRFARGIAHRSDGQLAEWYDNTMWHIEDIRRAHREQHFPQRTTSCSLYGGCEFRAICSKSPEVRKNFLAGDYERKPTWNPLAKR